MAGYRYSAYHPLTRQQLVSSLVLNNISWTEAVNGNAGFSATVTLPDPSETQRIEAIRGATKPWESAIYVRDERGQYTFGGPVFKRRWKHRERQIEFEGIHWRAWLYDVLLGPLVSGAGNSTYSWTGKDQLLIAREIIGKVKIGGTTDGRPNIVTGTETSGKTRDLNFKGTEFKIAGEILDTLSNRDDGFEWDLYILQGNDGLPELRFGVYYPERGGIIDGLFWNTGGNIISHDEIEEDGSNKRTRIWAYGDGESVPFAVDSDIYLDEGFTLLRESAHHFDRVTNYNTLGSHARAMREYLGQPYNLFKFTTGLDNPDVHSFTAGDRGRLVIDYDFLSLDVPSVRVLEKRVTPGNQTVEVTVNLNDLEPPEVDPEGV